MSATRIYGQQELRIAPGSATIGDACSKVKSGTTTSAGSAGGTTVVDTNGDSGAADAYNGRWVRILSGTCKGLWARVVDDDGAGTLTIENGGFPSQVASGVSYEIWTMPDAFCVVDGSGSQTDMVDATRDEANVNGAGFWVGYYAVPITGSHRGKVALITGFTPGTGTFVLAASFGTALAVGDVVLLRRFVEAEVDISLEESYFPRPSNRQNFSVGDGVVGIRGGSATITMDLRPSGTAAAAGSACGMNDASALLRACGLAESAGSTCTVGAGSTTAAIKIASGDREKLQIGQMVIWSGNPTFITSLVDGGAGVDTVNVSPSLPVAPASGDLLYGSRMYAKSTSGDCHGALVEFEIDGIRHTLFGCKGIAAIVDGDPLKLRVELQVDHWIRDTEAAPYTSATYATNAPVLGSDRQVWLSAVKTDIGTPAANSGTKIAPRNVRGSDGLNGRAGFQVSGYDPSLSFSELVDVGASLTQDLKFSARTAIDAMIAWGSHASTAAVRVPVGRLKESPHVTAQDDLVGVPTSLECQDAGTALNDTTITKVPDWAIHIS